MFYFRNYKDLFISPEYLLNLLILPHSIFLANVILAHLTGSGLNGSVFISNACPLMASRV